MKAYSWLKKCPLIIYIADVTYSNTPSASRVKTTLIFRLWIFFFGGGESGKDEFEEDH